MFTLIFFVIFVVLLVLYINIKSKKTEKRFKIIASRLCDLESTTLSLAQLDETIFDEPFNERVVVYHEFNKDKPLESLDDDTKIETNDGNRVHHGIYYVCNPLAELKH